MNIWSFKTQNFTINFNALPEDIPLDELLPDDTEKQINDLYNRLERGQIQYFCAQVEVLDCQDNELSSSYLGGCLYDDFEDFIDHRGNSRFIYKRKYEAAIRAHDWKACEQYRRAFRYGGYGSYFSDMVREAVKEARETFAENQSQYCAVNLKEH